MTTKPAPHHDYITVLISKGPPVNKRLVCTQFGIRKDSYQDAYLFNALELPVRNLRDLSEQLVALENESQALVIRGKVREGDYATGVRRQKHGDDAAFCEDPRGHFWIMIDFDAIPVPMTFDPLEDLEYATQYLARLLPRQFWDASYHWHWSGGAGTDGWATLRCHLWFWTTKRHPDWILKDWAKWVNHVAREAGLVDGRLIDDSVFQGVQPHFTANPTLVGVEDPCDGKRSDFHQGEINLVPLILPPKGWDRVLYEPSSGTTLTGGNRDRWMDLLARVGDDRDGFHQPITQAIASYVSTRDEHDFDLLKQIIRDVAYAAVNKQDRDLDRDYLNDRKLDGSIQDALRKYKGQS